MGEHYSLLIITQAITYKGIKTAFSVKKGPEKSKLIVEIQRSYWLMFIQ